MCEIQLGSAVRQMFVWWMVGHLLMVEWKCVWMGCGALSVMTDGTPEMPKSSADSSDLMDVS